MSNEYLPFAGGPGDNTQTYVEYLADAQRVTGNIPGLARAQFVNKALQQMSKMTAVLGDFITNYSGSDALDADTQALLLSKFDLALEAKITEVGNLFVPVGNIIMFPGETPPTGYLECNGASLTRAAYADLFAVLGTDYGSADISHFNIPDYRGRFLRGWDHGAGIDPNAATRTDRGDGLTGDHVGTKQADAFDAHTHFVASDETVSGSSAPDTTHSIAQTGQGSGEEDYILRKGTTTATVGLSSSAGGSETRPVNTNIMFCIKY